MSLKCIILEDQQDQLQTLESYIKRTPGIRLLASYDSGTRSIKHAEDRIDILFVNTHSKLVHDLHVTLMLRKAKYTIVVLPKKPQQTLALENESLGYLARPLSYNSFVEAVKAAETHIDKHPQKESKPIIQTSEYADSFFIRTDSQYIRLRYDDVLYVEAMRDFSKIYTTTKCYTILVNLKNLEGQLEAANFFRSHRSYLVNLAKIDSIESDTIHIEKHAVSLGVAYRDELIQKVTRRLVTRQQT